MRHGGGGFGHHNVSGTPPVGWFTALLPWLGLFVFIKHRKRFPATMDRALLGTLVMIPFTMFVGDQPYNCIWWDLAILGFGLWAADAEESTRH